MNAAALDDANSGRVVGHDDSRETGSDRSRSELRSDIDEQAGAERDAPSRDPVQPSTDEDRRTTVDEPDGRPGDDVLLGDDTGVPPEGDQTGDGSADQATAGDSAAQDIPDSEYGRQDPDTDEAPESADGPAATSSGSEHDTTNENRDQHLVEKDAGAVVVDESAEHTRHDETDVRLGSDALQMGGDTEAPAEGDRSGDGVAEQANEDSAANDRRGFAGGRQGSDADKNPESADNHAATAVEGERDTLSESWDQLEPDKDARAVVDEPDEHSRHDEADVHPGRDDVPLRDDIEDLPGHDQASDDAAGQPSADPSGEGIRDTGTGEQDPSTAHEEEASRENDESATDAPDEIRETVGHWLKGSHGNAGRIPKEIRDAMKDRNYTSWENFRSEFWKSIAESDNLSKHFKPENRVEMARGNAPFAHPSQHHGTRRRYELHHVLPRQHGGAVYDPGNLVVVTPKFHSEILLTEYHFGKRRP